MSNTPVRALAVLAIGAVLRSDGVRHYGGAAYLSDHHGLAGDELSFADGSPIVCTEKDAVKLAALDIDLIIHGRLRGNRIRWLSAGSVAIVGESQHTAQDDIGVQEQDA